jgi:ribonuclease R
LVHVASLQDDYYRYERASHTLTGHRAGNSFRLGDLVRVVVARVDVDRRELDLRIVSRGGEAKKSAFGLRAPRDAARRPGGKREIKGKGKGKKGTGGRRARK